MVSTNFAAFLSHLLGSCSALLISGPEQGIKRLNTLMFVTYCFLLNNWVQDLKVLLLFTFLYAKVMKYVMNFLL